MSTYAAHLDGGTVTRCIVGTSDWAQVNLGGTWVDSPHKVGNGWTLTDGGLRPPQPYPSWTWIEGAWTPPVPMPDGGMWGWDEHTQTWIEQPL